MAAKYTSWTEPRSQVTSHELFPFAPATSTPSGSTMKVCTSWGRPANRFGMSRWRNIVALMQIEHTMSIAAIASQPCCFLLRGEMAHYPDYAVKTSDAATIVIDVRSMKFTTPRDIVKFNRTAQVCDRLGWGYTVIEPLLGYEERNLVWLAGYRHRYAAPDEELEERIATAADSAHRADAPGTRIGRGPRMAVPAGYLPPHVHPGPWLRRQHFAM